MAKPYQGPVHVRVSLWETITSMIREQQRIVASSKNIAIGSVEERLMHETRGSINGLRSVLHTLRQGITEDLDADLEELYP